MISAKLGLRFEDLSEREVQIAMAGAFNAIHAVAWFPMPVGQEGGPEYQGRDKDMLKFGYQACWGAGLDILLPLMEERIQETKAIECGEWHAGERPNCERRGRESVRTTDALLERIAVAMELISGNQGLLSPRRSQTDFPWAKISNRTRNAVQNYRHDRWFPEEFRTISWPWTCEDIMRIGCRQLRKLPRLGEKATEEIHAAMEVAGFADWKLT